MDSKIMPHPLPSVDMLFAWSDFAHHSLFANSLLPWEPLTRLDSYLAHYPLGKIEVEIPAGVYLEHPETISIGINTRLEAGAYIRGPCIIGAHCQIRHGAYLRGHVLTGDHCVIGHASEVKNAIFLDYAHAPHFAYVGDSILGQHVNLGAGVVLANLKLNRSEVTIYANGEKYASGCKKLGALLGDGCQIGCHCVSNPGTILGRGCLSYPGLNFGGIFLASSVIKEGVVKLRKSCGTPSKA